MIRFLQSHGFAAFVGLVLYVGVTAWLWPMPQRIEPPTIGSKIRPVPAPSWEYVNPEVDQLVAELQSARTALRDRERDLNELAARLEAERVELHSVTQNVHRLQLELDQTFLRVREEEMANLKKLGRVYAKMSPEGAAGILKELEEATVVKIMLFMKENETAPILESLSGMGHSDLAAAISE